MKSPRRKRGEARALTIAAASHGTQLASMLLHQKAVLARLGTAHARENDPIRKSGLAAEISNVESVIAIREAELADALAQAEAERSHVS